MTPEMFWELFLDELCNKESTPMHSYYKFAKKDISFEFRKLYFLKRLNYVYKNIVGSDNIVWDCGCGYGTTGLFLAMNGIRTIGYTIEPVFYNLIFDRFNYWRQFGPVELFTVEYRNIFYDPPAPSFADIIIVQDTLHHLEPLSDALSILKNALKANGRIIVIEENGANPIQQSLLYWRRGHNKVRIYYDDVLGREVVVGDENIRNIKQWSSYFNSAGLDLELNSLEYIRFFPPFVYSLVKSETVNTIENFLVRKLSLVNVLFFGMNFIARHKIDSTRN